jgi:hypothetical protein
MTGLRSGGEGLFFGRYEREKDEKFFQRIEEPNGFLSSWVLLAVGKLKFRIFHLFLVN